MNRRRQRWRRALPSPQVLIALAIATAVGALILALVPSGIGSARAWKIVLWLAGAIAASTAWGAAYEDNHPASWLGMVVLAVYLAGAGWGGVRAFGSGCADPWEWPGLGEPVRVAGLDVAVTAVDRAAASGRDGHDRLVVAVEVTNRRIWSSAVFRPSEVRLEACAPEHENVLRYFYEYEPTDPPRSVTLGPGAREETAMLFEVPSGFPEAGYAFVTFPETGWKVRWDASCPDGMPCHGWRIENRPTFGGAGGCGAPVGGVPVGTRVANEPTFIGTRERAEAFVVESVSRDPLSGELTARVQVTNVGDGPSVYDGRSVRVAVCDATAADGRYWRFLRYRPTASSPTLRLNPGLTREIELRFRIPTELPDPGWVYIELDGWRTPPVLWASSDTARTVAEFEGP